MDFSIARQNMVDSQIRPNGITNPGLVAAMDEVARESFVPTASKALAYADECLDLGDGRYMLSPLVTGQLLQLANICPQDLVLDVGPGTGYSSALASHLAESVVGIEQDTQLCEAAGEKLMALNITNAAIICGKHVQGVASEAPFDVIILNGRVARFPQSLIDQLAEAGRMVAVLGERHNARLAVVTKTDGKISTRQTSHAFAPVLLGFEAHLPAFSF